MSHHDKYDYEKDEEHNLFEAWKRRVEEEMSSAPVFRRGKMGTYFAELEVLQKAATDVLCQACDTPLPRKGHGTKGPNGVMSFWTIRCPKCGQSHIIFNSTKVLPPIPDDAEGGQIKKTDETETQPDS